MIVDIICAVAVGILSALALYLGPKGLKYYINYMIVYLKILHYQRKTPKRLSKPFKILDPNATLEDIGMLPSPLSYQLENQQKFKDDKVSDGIHIFGIDTKKNVLDVKIKSIGLNQAAVWIVLNTSDGSYELPSHPDTRHAYVENDRYFNSCGLRIQCCSPLKRWRISFNGELKKVSSTDEGEIENLIHVKFSFVWLAISLVRDLKTDYRPYELAKAFMSAGVSSVDDKEFVQFENKNNCYEQWGQLMGTVNIGDMPVQELFLWSVRSRFLDEVSWDDKIQFVKLYLYFENAMSLTIDATTVEGLIFNYIHGYISSPGGSITDITQCDINIKDFLGIKFPSKTLVSFKNRGFDHQVDISQSGNPIKVHLGPYLERTVVMTTVTARMNDEDAFGVIYSGFKSKVKASQPCKMPEVVLTSTGCISTKEHLVLSLDEELCQNSAISGGKGSSLALLANMSKRTKFFSVSKGFVLTTYAFEKHIKANQNLADALLKLQIISRENNPCDLEMECKKCVQEFSSTELTLSLKEVVEAQLLRQFNPEDNTKFAIRSSALGEDSEEFSCAGLMSTYLGIKATDEIFHAILKCWASHFRFEAIQYLKQNGQPINSSMAVVIQEMVAADVAGVMFTVDPVSGNPAYPCITCNFGIGETVVSASVEPDTYILKKDYHGLLSLHEQKLGSKCIQEVMKEEGGTVQKNISEMSNKFCLDKSWALKIGDIGMAISHCFCGPRDIEWAIEGKTLFILQARPVTTLHQETEFELFHEQDTPIRSSYECYTRANTGEVFLGSSSPLSISLIIDGMDINANRNFYIQQRRMDTFSFVPYCCHWMPVTHRQVTLSLTDTLFRVNDKKTSVTQKAFLVALFGRVIETVDIHRSGVKKFGYITKLQKLSGLTRFLGLFFKSLKSEVLSKQVNNLRIDVNDFSNSKQTFSSICSQLTLFFKASTFHGSTTFISSIYNIIILSTLAHGDKAWDNSLYGDFANLLSSCTGVESAEVPSLLKEVAKAISQLDAMTFASVPVDDALSFLKNDTGLAGKLFREFLEKHGHRCVKEFDVHSLSWRMQPQKLIEILQNMVKSPNTINSQSKETTSVQSAINQLKTPLSRLSRLILTLVLPRSRNAVGKREQSKSLIIKVIDVMRESCYHLAKLLVEEGKLPEKDLMFFLTLDEIKILIESQDDFHLVAKALRRRRIHPFLDSLQFPEIMTGIPRPIQENEDNEIKIPSGSFTLKGTPVCRGIVTAKARVVLHLSEASSIKSGEILVTHATDIGWSPYFPLLSGVITVLGGLISHGAVVAREYGLPCIVGLEKATYYIKSGDLIVLNGNKGTVTRIEEYIETAI